MTQSKFWNGKSEFWNNKPEFWNSRREFWNGKSEFWNNKPEFWNRKKVVQKPGVSDTPGCCGPKRLKKYYIFFVVNPNGPKKTALGFNKRSKNI